MPKTKKSIDKDTSARSWFAVLNNPKESFGETLTPGEMIQKVIGIWMKDHEAERSCGVNYEISDTGTEHMHMVLEGDKKIRFSAVKKLFPRAHFEETRGNKTQAEDYLYKRGDYEEKNHTLVAGPVICGEIRAKPRGGAHIGSKNMKKAEIFELAEIMIENGATPQQIFEKGLQFRQYEKIIKNAYFEKRFKDTPPYRKVTVYYHFGPSGSGKTRTYSELCEKYGSDHIFLFNDYNNCMTSGGGFDTYGGEEILFMDEYKAQLPYHMLLNLLDGYRTQVHARYTNVYSLWNEIHITSIYPIEKIYDMTVADDDKEQDTMEQLMRRIDYISYHYLDGNKFKAYTISAKEYVNSEHMLFEMFKKQPPEHLAITEYGKIVSKEEYEALQKRKHEMAEQQKQTDLEMNDYMEQLEFHEIEGDDIPF